MAHPLTRPVVRLQLPANSLSEAFAQQLTAAVPRGASPNDILNGRHPHGASCVAAVPIAASAACYASIVRRRPLQARHHRRSWCRTTCGVGRQASEQSSGQPGTMSEVLLGLPDEFDGLRGPLARVCSSATQASERAEGLGVWRRALLRGELPAAADAPAAWPPDPLGAEIRRAIGDLNLPKLLLANPDLVDSVLQNLLYAAARFDDARAAAESQSSNAASSSSSSASGALGLNMSFGGSATSSDSASDAQQAGLDQADERRMEASQNSQDVPTADWDANAERGGNSMGAAAFDEEVAAASSEIGTPPGADGSQRAGAERDAYATQLGNDDQDDSIREDAGRWSMETEARAAAQGFRAQLAGLTDDGDPGNTPATSWEADIVGLPGSDEGSWSTPYGWAHLVFLRSLLGSLPELQEMVRKMGRRANPDAPLRREFAQRERRNSASGVIRSQVSQAETTGLTRSDGSLLLLPSELSLLAYANAQPPRVGAAGARALHRVRRAEASLLSYERSAWAEESTELLKRQELRPSGERGPLMVCLDTSRSMAGRREAIAKAAVVAVLREAEAERRPCLIYAFSGPGQVRTLDVPAPLTSMSAAAVARWQQRWWQRSKRVLRFLAGSFGGGTDLVAPLTAAVSRVQDETTWGAADLLIVTDGELGAPPPRIVSALQRLRDERCFRVFGLLVAEREAAPEANDSLDALCDECQRFEALGRVPLRWRPSEVSEDAAETNYESDMA